MSSFKSSENIQKKESGPDRSVSDNQSSSVTLNELAIKARKPYCNFKLQQRSHTMSKLKCCKFVHFFAIRLFHAHLQYVCNIPAKY